MTFRIWNSALDFWKKSFYYENYPYLSEVFPIKRSGGSVTEFDVAYFTKLPYRHPFILIKQDLYNLDQLKVIYAL